MANWIDLTWKNFLKQQKGYGGLKGSCAQLVLQLRGAMPSRSRGKLEEMRPRLTEEQFQTYRDALDTMIEERMRSKGGFVPNITPATWVQVKGGHMKKTHIEGYYDGYEVEGIVQ